MKQQNNYKKEINFIIISILLIISSSFTYADLYLNSRTGYINLNTTGETRLQITPGGNLNLIGLGNVSIPGNLSVGGNLSVDGLTYFVDAENNRVGIGTNSPLNSLHVDGSGADGGLRVTNNSGTEVFFVNSTLGRVGIGITSPDTLLHVANVITVGETDVANGGIQSADSIIINIDSNNDATDRSFTIFKDQDGIAGGGTNLFTILESGNIGIGGTQNPTEKLVVLGNLSINASDDTSTALFVDSTAGKVGIGTTIPSELLDVRGSAPTKINLNGTEFAGQLRAGGATGNMAGGIQLYAGTGQNLSLSANNGNVNGINILTGGNVGIGTTSPSYRLQVLDTGSTTAVNLSGVLHVDASNNRVSIGNASGGAALHVRSGDDDIGINIERFKNDVGSGVQLNFQGANLNSETVTYARINNSIVDRTAGSENGDLIFSTAKDGTMAEVMRLDDAGSVGIGTTSPLALFHIEGTEPYLRFNDTAGGDALELRMDSGGDFGFRNIDDGTTYILLDNAGNVGIGTTSPSRILEAQTSGANSQTQLRISTYNDQAAFTSVLELAKSHTDTAGSNVATIDTELLGTIDWFGVDSATNLQVSARISALQNGAASTGVPTDLLFYTEPAAGGLTERMRITTAGNVGIGTTNPNTLLALYSSSNNRFMNFSVPSTGNVGLAFGSAVSYSTIEQDLTTDDLIIQNNRSVSDSDIVFKTNAAERVRIDGNGNVGILDGGFCVGDDDTGIDCAAADGSIYYDVNAPAAYDLAEEIKASYMLEHGDVVVAATANETIELTSKPYDTKVVGVISTSPNIVFRSEDYSSLGDTFVNISENKAPLTIAGRVPTKVTNENGAIESGDLLTTSSKKGHAMKFSLIKAGEAENFEELQKIIDENERRRNSVLGKALETFDGENGKIIALITLQ